ncbi:MAG: hypothetical protein GQ534_03005, partial [Candidatus Delongbacteria bacterium]|nr:hypothetical protein [Candidatus Delongbacteria bacterium]
MKKILLPILAMTFSVVLYSGTVKYSDSWGSQGFSKSESRSTGITLVHSINEFSMNEQK